MKRLLCVLTPLLSLGASEFPSIHNSEPERSNPPTASDAAASFILPPGFKATVFASEPDVRNPIALAWDAKGRLWIAENYTYAERSRKFDLNLRDRILIFEDSDSDGRFDKRIVFTDEVQMLTSIEVGLGGAWAICPPNVLFIPDRDGDDVPDGAPEVVLDGFTVPSENYHNFANGLGFGPDGWLYGRCGASSPGEIGIPGTPSDHRIPMRGTMWRYHPVRRTFEALSCGTTNPWGHDWNEHGELFFINTVNGHLWHSFAGAHFVRPHTIDPNPRAYELIDQHADHWHFDTAGGWTNSRDGKANSYGGGHAHVGMMIYLGDNWPTEYRGRLFTVNMHGRRANQEILERTGSGYVGRHGTDFFLARDPWFRGMELSYGPDGGVFALDWSDTGECHESTGVHRASGRIYKISFGDPDLRQKINVAALSNRELADLHTNKNEWFVRQARLELSKRLIDGNELDAAARRLHELFRTGTSVVEKLRALWSISIIGAADESFLRALLLHEDEHIRTWAIRLLADAWPLDTVLSHRPLALKSESNEKRPTTSETKAYQRTVPSRAAQDALCRAAELDESGLVRLALASTLQRLPMRQRADLAAILVGRSEDANDHNLPLLIWYGLIPLADADPAALARIAAVCELPATRRLIARRLAEDIESNPAPVNHLVELCLERPESFRADILSGMAEGLAGWRKASKPFAWDALARALAGSENESLQERVRNLGVVFGDGRAMDEVRELVLDEDSDLQIRKIALQTLINSRPPNLREICESALNVRFLNTVAARGLSGFDDPEIGARLARAYSRFHPSERPQLLSTLVSRPSFAGALLDAVANGRIPRRDISTFAARQILSFKDPVLSARLTEVWGQLRDSSGNARELTARWKSRLDREDLARADKSNGRIVFNMACGSCHTLYGEGGAIGPDLTGSGRDNLDYLLENITDPSAVVTADYRMSVVNLNDGRVLNGIVAATTERTLTLATATESLILERSEIERIEKSELSLMPDGLLESMEFAQACDLIAYLMHQSQVPLQSRKSADAD